MNLWPLNLGIAFAAVYALLYYSGWVNAAATLVLALFLGPILYVLVVILFFDDTPKPPKG